MQGGATRKRRVVTRVHPHTYYTYTKPYTWSASAHIFHSRIYMSNGTEILGGVAINSARERVLGRMRSSGYSAVYLVFRSTWPLVRASIQRTPIGYLKLRCGVSKNAEILYDTLRSLVILFSRRDSN